MHDTLKAAASTYGSARNVATLWLLSLALPALVVVSATQGHWGIAAGASIAVALLATLLAFYVRRRRRLGDWALSDTIAYVVVPCLVAAAIATMIVSAPVHRQPVRTAAAKAADHAAATPPLPLASGQYAFMHRFAEQPAIAGLPLTARIDGRHIVLVNDGPADVFPHGVIAEGTLMWHAASRQWIIGAAEADRSAAEVGDCSGGPDVVDLAGRVYWTC